MCRRAQWLWWCHLRCEPHVWCTFRRISYSVWEQSHPIRNRLFAFKSSVICKDYRINSWHMSGACFIVYAMPLPMSFWHITDNLPKDSPPDVVLSMSNCHKRRHRSCLCWNFIPAHNGIVSPWCLVLGSKCSHPYTRRLRKAFAAATASEFVIKSLLVCWCLRFSVRKDLGIHASAIKA